MPFKRISANIIQLTIFLFFIQDYDRLLSISYQNHSKEQGMNFELNEEQRMWQKVVHDFVSTEVKPKAREVDQNSTFNWEATRKMGPLGLLGLSIPEEYGGSGVDAVSAAIAIEELGWGCGSTALAIAAHNGLGTSPITIFGSEELKHRWLPLVTSGRGKLGALALTEPGAGSDLQGGVRTRAERIGDEWVINGSKMWCTNASIAEYIITLVRTNPAGGARVLRILFGSNHKPGPPHNPTQKKMGVKGSPHPASRLARPKRKWVLRARPLMPLLMMMSTCPWNPW